MKFSSTFLTIYILSYIYNTYINICIIYIILYINKYILSYIYNQYINICIIVVGHVTYIHVIYILHVYVIYNIYLLLFGHTARHMGS